jgi:hypothetical protein
MLFLRSYNWAQWSQRSAIRVHTVRFSRLRVNLAMSSHSAANRMNFSAGSSIGCFLPVLIFCLEQQNQDPFERFQTNLNFKGGENELRCLLLCQRR